jgi:hypothetical protein
MTFRREHAGADRFDQHQQNWTAASRPRQVVVVRIFAADRYRE